MKDFKFLIITVLVIVGHWAGAQEVIDASLTKVHDGKVWYQDIPVTGTVVRWLSPGVKAVESNYVYGVLNGLETTYNNGKKYIEITFKDGAFEGLYKQWYPNGQLEYTKVYEGGLMNGPAVFFHENGSKQAEGTYAHCKETGTWNFWYPNGKLLKTGLFVEGFEDGLWTFWHDTGTKWKEVVYKEGEEVNSKVINDK